MNLEEVAKRAKVSTATVSRVLNNASVVKAATRARVLKAMNELNYHPNLHARTLAGGKSRTIGLIVSNLANPFFLDIFRAVEEHAHARGYEVLIANTDYRPEQLVTNIRLMIGRRVAGLAVIVSEMDQSLLTELVNYGIRAVFYDVGAAKASITNIRVDYARGMEKVITYLHGLGHRKLGFVGHHSKLDPIHRRLSSVMDMIKRFSPAMQVKTVADVDGPDGGRRAAQELLRSGFKPTAIVCVNDYMAVGVLKELRSQGLRVPGDVSITGFDNINLSEYCEPALTTVHIPRDRIGRLALETLISEESGDGRDIVIDPEFIVRDSTAPPPPNRK